MELPFDLNDVRLICIDGDTIRFVLKNGHVEVTIDSRSASSRLPEPAPQTRTAGQHTMFDDGIFGI